MKNTKWTANELLDSLNRECNQEEINELYKAMIAYSIGLTEIDEAVDEILDNIIEEDYFGNDYIRGIVNEDIMEAAEDKLADYLD
jgi:hypothetical protein